MNEDEIREQLAAALEDAGVSVWLERTLLADALLPVVRQAQAAALRSAAEFFASRLPDGTGNGRAYNSYRVAQLLEDFADNLSK